VIAELLSGEINAFFCRWIILYLAQHRVRRILYTDYWWQYPCENCYFADTPYIFNEIFYIQ